MSTFTPPAQSTVPPVLPPGNPEQTPAQYALMRHYRSRPEGINVYLLSDGTVTETDPDSQRVFWAAGDGPAGCVTVARAFLGGHDAYEVNDAEAALLTGAGYTVDA